MVFLYHSLLFGLKSVFVGLMMVALLCDLVCLEEVGYINVNDSKWVK